MTITYTLGLGFEDIVSCFTASGITSDKLLQYLSVSDMKALREKQTSEKVKKASDDILLTLIAIRILTDCYKDDKKLWTLVNKKARKALHTSLTASPKDLLD